MNEHHIPAAAARLPKTVGEHLTNRGGDPNKTLNDHVEDIHLLLYENDDYRSYLEAVYDEQAVDGSLAMDNAKAAEMIRSKALKIPNHVVAKQKLASISKALGVALRRAKASRKQRRNMIGGEIVPDDNGND